MKIILLIVVIFSVNFSFGQQEKSPKLVVGIVVDQMCYDYIYRYYSKYSEGGFKKLMSEGTNCRNTQYNYIPTYTGPGHASIYTGTTPNNHGIVANDWFDRSTGKNVNCVTDSTVTPVGTTSEYGYYSPRNLKANTVTDQLKLTYPKAKVISMSIKNRGAILPGGHLSDGSYWYDFTSGKFITSSYFESELPKWVNDFNQKKYVEKYMKGEWNTMLDISEYTESETDNSPYEHLLPGKKSPVFPYVFSDMLKEKDQTLQYEVFAYTPYSNTFLTDFALSSIDAEDLGKDNQTDMLCISYSTPDLAGHAFGPYSVEMEDMYIRLDLEIKRLIDALESKVGKGEFTLFLTADHAVVPVPQFLMDKNLPGGYFYMNEHFTSLRSDLNQEFGVDCILSVDNMNIYLDKPLLKENELDYDEVVDFIRSRVQNWENVKRVFTAKQLYSSSSDDEWMDMVRRGYHHAESGDVIFILEPGFLPKSSNTELAHKGTSHGSAFNYDTHVPLLWYGANIPSQEIYRNIQITDISATLAQFFYIQMPNALTGKPIVELLKR